MHLQVRGAPRPDRLLTDAEADLSQCTYRCVVLPDRYRHTNSERMFVRLNAPTGAWCSLTRQGG